jgi:hypothetical protein
LIIGLAILPAAEQDALPLEGPGQPGTQAAFDLWFVFSWMQGFLYMRERPRRATQKGGCGQDCPPRVTPGEGELCSPCQAEPAYPTTFKQEWHRRTKELVDSDRTELLYTAVRIA